VEVEKTKTNTGRVKLKLDTQRRKAEAVPKSGESSAKVSCAPGARKLVSHCRCVKVTRNTFTDVSGGTRSNSLIFRPREQQLRRTDEATKRRSEEAAASSDSESEGDGTALAANRRTDRGGEPKAERQRAAAQAADRSSWGSELACAGQVESTRSRARACSKLHSKGLM
jgi:hypothetical protein